MPQWAGSCWYYLRYLDPNNNKEMVSLDKEEYWMPVDLYVGGAEHATRHLLYARFWHKFLYDIGRVTTKEPFKRLVHVGLILAEDGRKMSKRWKNVINPDDIIGVYGADSLRLYEMFMGPFIQSIAWNTDGLKGIRRFLEKVYELGLNRTSNEWPAISSPELERKLNQTIKKVTLDIEEFRFNTAISSMMELVNAINTQESNSKVGLSKVDFEKFLIILSPFAPHMMEEMWENLGNVESIFRATWPVYDKTLIKDDVITVAVQINGKVRDQIIAIPGATKDEIFALAKESVKTKKYLEGVTIQKVIYVQDKLLSIVIT
jgi:leucyl-tRNA synthetase